MSAKAYVGIPTSYTPVEYIESSGTQYIDTGIVPTSTTKAEIKFMLTSTTQEQYPCIFGCQGTSSSGNGCYKLRNYIGSNLNFQSGNNSATSNISGAINTAYVATCEHGKLVLNGSTFTTTSTWTNLNAHIYLFASYNLAESSVLSTTRTVGSIYYCKIYENNSLIRDFIPVLDGSNVACLYDLVEGKFYYNAGSGNFTYGTASTPVTVGSFARKVKKIYVGIPTSYTPVEYIESSGTQYIDTGIVRDITKVFRFVASVKWNDVSTRQCIGAQGYVYFGVSGGKYQIAQGGTTTTSVTATTGSFADIDLTFNCPSNTCTGSVNNTSIGTISATYQNSPTDAHIHLFSLNDLVLPSSVQIASFKIYQNNVLVRDFIPVLNDSNVACMFDLVENKFYYNKGSGTFNYGAVGEPIILGDFARKVKKAYVGVPASYTPVEYIESSGTQYIDTGVPPKPTTKLEFDANIVSGDTNVWLGVWGSRTTATSDYFCLYAQTSSPHYLSPNYAGFDPGTSGNTPINFNQRYVLTQDKGQFYIDGVKATALSTTNTLVAGTQPIYLFTNNNLGTPQMRGQDIKLYGCKIYDGDTLIRNFIPAVNQDNVACLYEQVEGKFYYNKGTGTFTAGSTTGEQVVVGSVARLCYKGTTIWEAFIELCRANPTKSAASEVLQYQTQIESLMAQNGKDVNSYHSIFAYTNRNTFEVIFVVPTTYWYKYGEVVSGTTYAFYISGRSGSQYVQWLSASDIRYGQYNSSVSYSNNVIGVFSKASSGGSPSGDCVVQVMSE